MAIPHCCDSQTMRPPKTPVEHHEACSPDVRSDPVYVVKAQLFRVLGHPLRIRILEILISGERTVRDLQAELDLDSSGTSQHLAALRRLGLPEHPPGRHQHVLRPPRPARSPSSWRGRPPDPHVPAPRLARPAQPLLGRFSPAPVGRTRADLA